jgi:2-keto-4-pentenoate hydratase/2-oxohepta-3-ene-1,7-dioic acid hydratase in catechol pathway
MKIVSFGPRGSEQPGLLRDDGRVVPLTVLLAELGMTPLSTPQLLGMLPQLQPLLAEALSGSIGGIPQSEVRVGSPVPHPEKVIVTGANYQAHLDEASGFVGAPSSSQPLLYFKPSNTVIGATDDLVRPALTEQLDYEVELGIVIGRGGRNISKSEAPSHIAGYVICNDLTARDLIGRDAKIHPYFLQLTRAKGIASAPIGPWLVTPDEVGDAQALDIRCWINGELRQEGNTGDMIFDIPTMVADFSEALTLSPGDIIMTGTTAGSGAAQDPPAYLRAGDIIRMEITGLGVMETHVVEETVAA